MICEHGLIWEACIECQSPIEDFAPFWEQPDGAFPCPYCDYDQTYNEATHKKSWGSYCLSCDERIIWSCRIEQHPQYGWAKPQEAAND